MTVGKGRAAWEVRGLVSSRDAQGKKKTKKAILEGPRHLCYWRGSQDDVRKDNKKKNQQIFKKR